MLAEGPGYNFEHLLQDVTWRIRQGEAVPVNKTFQRKIEQSLIKAGIRAESTEDPKNPNRVLFQIVQPVTDIENDERRNR